MICNDFSVADQLLRTHPEEFRCSSRHGKTTENVPYSSALIPGCPDRIDIISTQFLYTWVSVCRKIKYAQCSSLILPRIKKPAKYTSPSFCRVERSEPHTATLPPPHRTVRALLRHTALQISIGSHFQISFEINGGLTKVFQSSPNFSWLIGCFCPRRLSILNVMQNAYHPNFFSACQLPFTP